MSISLAVKDHAQSRQAQPGSAYYPVARSDWGVLAPGTTGTAFGNGNLTNVGSGGSLANGSFFAKITWVTAQGETTPSAEGTVTVTGGPSGSVTIALGSTGSTNTGSQLNAQPIIGWNIYTSSTTNTELLNNSAASLSVALATQTLPNGTVMTYIPIATTSVTVKVLGAGPGVPVVNTSGIQPPLPNVAANGSADIQIKVPVSFNIARPVTFSRPNAVADPAGISLAEYDVVAPLWPGNSQSVSAGALIVADGRWLFQCTVPGTTQSSGVPNFSGSTKFGTVTDGTVTWTNLGKWNVLTLRFQNSSASAAQPVANEFDFWQP